MLRKPICPDTLAALYAAGETIKNIATRMTSFRISEK